jgi:hypothetical protein
MFPEVCGICIPERRFQLPKDKANHDRMKHGAIQDNMFYDYSMHPTCSSKACLPSDSSLHTITANDLNRFVKKEIEPTAQFKKSCNAVVDRLCKVMKNSFPKKLRPAEVIKVNYCIRIRMSMLCVFFKLLK